MQTQNVRVEVVGPSMLTIMTILFVILKMTGTVAWSWAWVLAPTWIPLSIVVAVAIFGGIMACVLR